VRIATQENGIEWEGNVFNATVKWIEAGRLMNATSKNISHAEMANKDQPVVAGRVAVLYVNTVKRSDEEQRSAAVHSLPAICSSSFLLTVSTVLVVASTFLL